MLPGTESNKDSFSPLSLIFIYQTRSGSAISSLGYFIPTKVPFWNTQNFGTYFWRKCPALGIKNYTVGGMETAFTLPNSPKNIGIGFYTLSILPHSVNFWMIFICFAFMGRVTVHNACFVQSCSPVIKNALKQPQGNIEFPCMYTEIGAQNDKALLLLQGNIL